MILPIEELLEACLESIANDDDWDADTHRHTLTPNTAQYMKRRTSGVDLKDPLPIVLSYPLLHALLSVDLQH